MDLLDILIPLFLLIILGYFLKAIKFPSLQFWSEIERMTYYVLFPTLIFIALLKAPVDLRVLEIVLIVVLIPTLISGVLQWFGLLSPQISGPTFTSMFQGAIRFNTPVALVIASWLAPEKGVAILAVVILIMIPVANFLSIIVLLKYGKNNDEISNKSLFSFISNIFKNPLIIACMLGLLFNVLGIRLPESIIETAEFLGRSALPFALLAVGAGLTFKSVLKEKLAILLSTSVRLILTPLLCWMLCLFLNVEAEIAKIVIVFCAMPTAITSYILAKQMGGNGEAMAQIITFQTSVAAVTLPIFLIIAQQY